MFADATQAFTILVDLTSPITTDNVPATNADAPFEVTLSASDSGGSGLTHTYDTTGVTPATTTTASAVYDPANKPVLTVGQRISYFSTDGAGNSETVKTSHAAGDTAPPTISISSPAGSYGLRSRRGSSLGWRGCFRGERSRQCWRAAARSPPWRRGPARPRRATPS